MKVYYENKTIIDISHNLVHHNQMKYVEMGMHFIKEKIQKGIICISYIFSSKQEADLPKKNLVRLLFKKIGSQDGNDECL